jgi:predicted transcriptional regulator
MTENDQKVYDICTTPFTSRQIAAALGITYRSAQCATYRLTKNGYLVKKHTHLGGLGPTYTYTQAERFGIVKNYTPVNLCVMGVWL